MTNKADAFREALNPPPKPGKVDRWVDSLDDDELRQAVLDSLNDPGVPAMRCAAACQQVGADFTVNAVTAWRKRHDV